MNQMLQDAPEVKELREVNDATEGTGSPDVTDPPVRAHSRFAKPQRVAFVQSSWHRDVVEECRKAFLAEIEERGIEPARIDLFEVPGSFEIPLHAQLLAKTRRYTADYGGGGGGAGAFEIPLHAQLLAKPRRYTAIVAAGLVVDGGIDGAEFDEAA